MFFSFIFFLGAAVLAIILQLAHQRALRKGKSSSLVGRTSSLDNQYPSNMSYGLKKYSEAQLFPTDMKKDHKGVTSIARESVILDMVVLGDEVHMREGFTNLDINATSRLQLLVETGAFDDILDCVQEIKRQKEN